MLASSARVEVLDVDEEVFHLYTQLNAAPTAPGGLGFHSDRSGTLPLAIVVAGPPIAGKGKRRISQEITVELEIQQNLHSLRNTPGDTGSVLWRSSLLVARHVLQHYHFPTTSAPLVPHWSTATVLELGSGTGFLGLCLRSTVKTWTFSDRIECLPLVAKNATKNGVVGELDMREIDWLVECDDHDALRALPSSHVPPDVILVVDGIFNPTLSVALAKTITRIASPATTALIVAELRDSEPLELFLSTFLSLGWRVHRLCFAPEEGLGSAQFVVWVGERQN